MPPSRGVAIHFAQYVAVQHTLGNVQTGFLLVGQPNRGGIAFGAKLFRIKPRKPETQCSVAAHFVLNVLEHREHIVFLPELHPQQGPDALGQPQVSVGVQKNQCQRVSSS